MTRLRDELGVQSLDDLRAALAAHKLAALKGFGAKSEAKIAESLARLEAQGVVSRTPISVALPLATRIVARLSEVAGVTHAAYCGSLRRFAETCGDVDVVVAANDAAPVMEAFLAMPLVDRVLGRGDTKTSVVTPRGIQIDVRVVAPHQLGAALLYFTGSKSHNVKLRQRALGRGYTLNEYALTALEGGKVIASETEEEIYAALGLPFIAPVLREDWGEIEAAESGILPKPLGAVTGDFHLHTSMSGDGRSSLEEMVAGARARGYRAMAVTDHAEGTVSGVGREAFLEQRQKIRALQAQLGDAFRLLHGVELNIGAEGELDYDLEFRRGFDWCLASVHDHLNLDRAAQTKRVVAAMRDPTVRMIGHLTTRMIGGRPPIDLDPEAILSAAADTGTALEINGALPRLDLPTEWLRRAAGRNIDFLLDSDAHQVDELERSRYAKLNAERAGVDPARVMNAGDGERLLAWLARERVHAAAWVLAAGWPAAN